MAQLSRVRLSDLPIHETNSLEVCNILTYEVGDLVKAFAYAKRYAAKDDDGTIDLLYKTEARVALADVMAQCQVLCEMEGWNLYEVIQLGVERMKEKVLRHRQLGE